MNQNILRLANVMLLGFIGLLAALFYWQVVRAGDLTSDPALNRTRLMEQERNVKRGAILDRNGLGLAANVEKPDGNIRHYELPSLVHVVGYHSVRFGNSAVEASFDDYLRGGKGLDAGQVFESRVVRRTIAANDVVLSVDARLQQVADKALGNDNGAIVAIDPRDGGVLAMVSHPYFDPNTMDRDWDKLREDAGKPLLNRATQGLYTPGSIFKTVTLASALEAGVTRPDEVFAYAMKVDERGQWYHEEFVSGFRIYDANHGPNEGNEAVLDLAHAYAESCNVAFADLGLRLGPKRLVEGASRFGFGSEVPIEIPAVASRLGVDGLAKGDAAVASTAFGQGELQVTPLQMALVAASVARGGSVPKPFVVQSVRGAGGETFRAVGREWRRAMSPEVASTVAAMMVVSAEEGWATTGQIPGVKVAAKTGTAESGPGRGTHAWFIAYAPVENPRVAVAVVKEYAGGGARESGPAAKQVMEAALALGALR